MKKSDKKAYEHEYLGKVTGTGGEVFRNVEIRKISDSEKNEFDRISRGLDWGYAADPLHYTVNHYDKTRRRLYIFYEIHVTGMSNIDAVNLIKKENKRNDFRRRWQNPFYNSGSSRNHHFLLQRIQNLFHVN